jgi:hypothetical protein
MKPIEQTPELAAEIVAEWKASPELRAEFNNDITCFSAYKRAVAQGLARTARSAIVVGSAANAGDGGTAKPKKEGKKAKKEKKHV